MFTTRAFAKVNLDLRVSPVRPDGYHELRTIFQAIGLADVLTLARGDGPFALACDDAALPTGPENLAVRGASAVARTLGRPLDGWRLHLQKHVPAEAGLGGGSADAVAAARLVLAAHGAEWPDARLADVLAPLGSDVPYFVHGGTALGVGRGDQVTPLDDLPTHGVLVVRPDVGVATRDAYGWFDAAPPPVPSPPLVVPASPEAWAGFLATCGNDLQPAVVARLPLLGEGLRRLAQAGATLALMSGSGSALFGLFPDDAAARRAGEGWAAPWRTWVTRTLRRAEYRAATRVIGPDAGTGPLSATPTVV